ncbi:MAG: tetratricopeptide repeat protein [Zoogloeaceae bacterium]|jgi:tetratricopeptide (TPR) repeat protein|nr:tetratricopeptide repeat protein [Zoogloeaceae bacterium]
MRLGNLAGKDGIENEQALFANALTCFLQGRFAEAFSALSKWPPGQHPAVEFNLGLCHLKTADFQSAIRHFETALRQARPGVAPENNPAYKTLRAAEIRNQRYLEPMSFDHLLTFANEAKEDIIMALAFAHDGCGLKDKARVLTASLVGDQFSEFKAKFQ